MAVKSLAQSSLKTASSTNSMLAGYETNQFHHLETVRLGGTASVVQFSNLARYSDYQHLQIRVVGSCSAENWLTMSFNGITTGSSYRNHLLRATTGGVNSFSSGGEGNGVGYVALMLTTASSCVIDILDAFDTGKNRVIRALSGNSVNSQFGAGVALASGLYLSTDATSSIEVRAPGSTFTAGTRISLYGLKARA